jgi:hypothetical protein
MASLSSHFGRILDKTCTFDSILASLLGFLPSLDQPIRSGEQLRRNRQTDLLGRLEIDHQLELRRLLGPFSLVRLDDN